ncbi:MAG: MBL fold metallo-hydrolase [Nocardioidaceae bacterium]
MDGPRVTALGHAGLRIETPTVRVLADPWVSPGGAFLGSWFPFPDNRFIADGPRPLLDADVVVVSHEHLDHLDLTLLGSMPKAVRVVVPRYPSTILQQRLRGAGILDLTVLDPWERFPLSAGGGTGPHDDWLTVIPEQCPMSHDAAVLFHVSGQAILHTNDARISVAQIRRAVEEAGRPIDLMAVQMSGASWHPVCYEYPPEQLATISEQKRIGKFKAVTRLVRSVAPGAVLPYAGPPCFLDPTLLQHNGLRSPSSVFPDQGEALDWLRQHLPQQRSHYLLPGEHYEVSTHTQRRLDRWTEFRADTSRRARVRYLEEYADRRAAEIAAVWAAHPDPPATSRLGERFAEHMETLGTLSGYFLARVGITLRLEVAGEAGGVWDTMIGPSKVSVDLTGRCADPSYRIRLDARWLDGVVTGETRWEELLLSLRLSARREPDHYNDYLVGLLKHADLAALRAVEAYETKRDRSEMITVVDGDRSFRVSRYCPHAGEDLAETAVVKDGVLRCLGHNFEFDLRSGDCLNARCEPLLIDPAGDLVSSAAR